MQLRRKVVLIVISSILLAAVPGAALVYGLAQRSVLANESVALEKQTAVVADLAMQRFARGKPKLMSFALVLEKELAKPIRPEDLAAFDALAQHDADGAWRNRREGYDGRNEAGLFLPPGDEKDNEQKVRHLRIKQVMDTFGAAASEPLENVWYLSPERGEVIFDRNIPEFTFNMKADTDYTQTPWLTFTSPRLNPNREFRFTPPLFDPVANFWMVSALYPLYVNGQWIGSLGEDMQYRRGPARGFRVPAGKLARPALGIGSGRPVAWHTGDRTGPCGRVHRHFPSLSGHQRNA